MTSTLVFFSDCFEIFNVDENSRHKRELDPKDMDEMKKTVIEAATKIRKNNFNKCCGSPECVCRFKGKSEG